jgi:hypothetical protein
LNAGDGLGQIRSSKGVKLWRSFSLRPSPCSNHSERKEFHFSPGFLFDFFFVELNKRGPKAYKKMDGNTGRRHPDQNAHSQIYRGQHPMQQKSDSNADAEQNYLDKQINNEQNNNHRLSSCHRRAG